MFLSYLLVDTGADASRPRPGRSWVGRPYRVHQRLCMAFPDDRRRADDPHFLAPFNPSHFAQHVRTPRHADAGFLFRIDPLSGVVPSRHGITVQSAIEPDWDYAFHNAPEFLAAAPMVKPFNLPFSVGQRLRFRLMANPIRKVSQRSVDAQGQPLGERWLGKHVPVPATDEHLHDWLERRAEPRWSAPKNSEQQQPAPGFRLVEVTNIQPGYLYVNKTDDPAKAQRLCSARFDGLLEITDPVRFRDTLIRGLGAAKAFGFGLLSVAPWRE